MSKLTEGTIRRINTSTSLKDLATWNYRKAKGCHIGGDNSDQLFNEIDSKDCLIADLKAKNFTTYTELAVKYKVHRVTVSTYAKKLGVMSERARKMRIGK